MLTFENQLSVGMPRGPCVKLLLFKTVHKPKAQSTNNKMAAFMKVSFIIFSLAATISTAAAEATVRVSNFHFGKQFIRSIYHPNVTLTSHRYLTPLAI